MHCDDEPLRFVCRIGKHDRNAKALIFFYREIRQYGASVAGNVCEHSVVGFGFFVLVVYRRKNTGDIDISAFRFPLCLLIQIVCVRQYQLRTVVEPDRVTDDARLKAVRHTAFRRKHEIGF